MQERRKFQENLIDRPYPKGLDVVCRLKHFAIITYAVPAIRFDGVFPDRFELDTIDIKGEKLGIVNFHEQQTPYSVLIEQLNEFTIYLPPTVIG
jgi:hypothetical protein